MDAKGYLLWRYSQDRRDMARSPRYPTWTGIACRESTTENLWVKLEWVNSPGPSTHRNKR
jgi:hypothetical protein